MKLKKTKEKTRKAFHSIMSRILLPVVVAILVQAGLFAVNIIWGGTISKLNQNAFGILDMQVANRRNYLQNEMLERWSNLNPVAEDIRNLINSAPSASSNDELLTHSAPKLISLLRRNLVTGVFLILTDGEIYTEDGDFEKHALYIRDMDPITNSVNNSDLLLLHAPARLSKQLAIPLDSRWQPRIHFSSDTPQNWEYYRKPLLAAKAYPDVQEVDLGYWSPVFRAEGDSIDTITYSMPLRDQYGIVQAIIGVEISIDYLSKQIPYQELNADKQGMYLVGIANDSSLTFTPQLSTGPVYKHVFGQAEQIPFASQEDYSNVFQVVDNASHSGEKIYGCIQYFTLYNSNTPFENERWALIGMLDDYQLLGFSQGIIWAIAATLVISLIIAFMAAWVANALLSRPITKLLAQLQDSELSHPLKLQKLQIFEIDELSNAIESLSVRVAREASRLSQIIDMAGVEIAAFEAKFDSDQVFYTSHFFKMLGLSKESEQDGTVNREEFDALMETLNDKVEDRSEDNSVRILRIARSSDTHTHRWVRLKIVSTDEYITGVVTDITHEVLKRQKVEKERDYDLLTNLFNRRAFGVELAKRFQNPEQLGIGAMVMLDLDNLKFINDTYGHDCGDAYIRSMAEALQCHTPKDTLIARMSGDEFYVLFSGYSSKEELEEVILILENGIRRSMFMLPDHSSINIRASAGVAWYPEHATSYELLIKYADFAMYQVKNTTKGSFGEFNIEHYNRDAYLLQNQEAINHLIDEELITFHFQPIVDAKNGSVFGYEALMRPLLQTLKSPKEVLTLAKSQSKLYGIERLTWRKSLEQFEQLPNIPSQLRLFVNSIANQLLNEKDSEQIQEQFSHLFSRVIVEITEEERSTEDLTLSKLKWASDWGCQVALDDFGTGYNSDSALLAIDPNFVKLDISIVRNVDTDLNRRKILENLLSYADSRGIAVIAEGVETSAELHTLIGLGVDYVQGYYVARPQLQPAPLPEHIVEEIKETYAKTK